MTVDSATASDSADLLIHDELNGADRRAIPSITEERLLGMEVRIRAGCGLVIAVEVATVGSNIALCVIPDSPGLIASVIRNRLRRDSRFRNAQGLTHASDREKLPTAARSAWLTIDRCSVFVSMVSSEPPDERHTLTQDNRKPQRWREGELPYRRLLGGN